MTFPPMVYLCGIHPCTLCRGVLGPAPGVIVRYLLSYSAATQGRTPALRAVAEVLHGPPLWGEGTHTEDYLCLTNGIVMFVTVPS